MKPCDICSFPLAKLKGPPCVGAQRARCVSRTSSRQGSICWSCWMGRDRNGHLSQGMCTLTMCHCNHKLELSINSAFYVHSLHLPSPQLSGHCFECAPFYSAMLVDPFYQPLVHHEDLRLATDLWSDADGEHQRWYSRSESLKREVGCSHLVASITYSRHFCEKRLDGVSRHAPSCSDIVLVEHCQQSVSPYLGSKENSGDVGQEGDWPVWMLSQPPTASMSIPQPIRIFLVLFVG